MPITVRVYKGYSAIHIVHIHEMSYFVVLVLSCHARFHASATAAGQLTVLQDSSVGTSARVAPVKCAGTYLLQGMSAGTGAASTVAMTAVSTMRTALSCIMNAAMFAKVGVSISRKRSHIKYALTSFYAGEGGQDDAGGLVAGPYAFYVPAARF